MTTTEDKYIKLREKLDDCGYHQPLSFESLLLVEKLLNDILHYQNDSYSQKKLAEDLMKHYNMLKINQEPLEREYKSVCKENNCLHLQIIQERDKFEENLRGLKIQISQFENAFSDMESMNMQHITRIGKLEEEIFLKNKKLLQYGEIVCNFKERNIHATLNMSHIQDRFKISAEDNVNASTVISTKNKHVSDKYTETLCDEIAVLKSERTKFLDIIELYKQKIHSRDKEIKRLYSKVEKKATPFIINPVCKCHIFEENMFSTVERDVENTLEESRIKCHTLMDKIINLATFIKLLEKKIEEKHSDLGKLNKEYSLYGCLCKKVKQLQTLNECCFCRFQHNNKMSDIDNPLLSTEMCIGTQEDTCDETEVEKKKFKRVMGYANNKGLMTHSENEKLRQHNMLTSELNALLKKFSQSFDEINILKQENLLLKTQLSQFEIIKNINIQEKNIKSQNGLDIPGSSKSAISNVGKHKPDCLQTDNHTMKKCIFDEKRTERYVLDHTVETSDINNKEMLKSLMAVIEKVTAERDYYCKEYHCLQDKVCHIHVSDISTSENHNEELIMLRHQTKLLTDQLKKLEDALKSEKKGTSFKIYHLQEIIKSHEKENNLLNDRFQESKQNNSNLLRDVNKLQEQFNNLVTKNDQLESENNKMKNTIATLQHELKMTEILTTQENKIGCTSNRYKFLESDNYFLNKSSAHSNQQEAKVSLFLLEKEKDLLKCQLDEKAVKICEIEKINLEKDILIRKCEEEVTNLRTELKRALQVTEMYAKEIGHSKKEIEQLLNNIDTLTIENQNLMIHFKKIEKQNDDLHTNIEYSEIEVVKLKRKLQVYVEEVRRVEELLEAKEEEREKLLEQFKILVEATESDISNKNLRVEEKLCVGNSRQNSHLNIDFEHSFNLKSKVNIIENEVEGLKHQVSSLKNNSFHLQDGLTETKVADCLIQEERIEDHEDDLRSSNHNLQSTSESFNSFQNENTRLKRTQINKGGGELNSYSTSL